MCALLTMFLSYVVNPVMYPVYRSTVKGRGNLVYNNEGDSSSLIESLTPPSGGELKLLTHLNGNAWAQNWLLHMGRTDTEVYDDHYCTECLSMKESSNIYTSEEYLYFGFFPDGCSGKAAYEPKYLALFVVQPKKRALNAKLIVENPKFINEETRLIDLENSLRRLCDESYVFFKFDELKRPGQIRYYYEWTFTN
jgi:hypothetical protein